MLKFALDRSLGKLCKWIRLLGFDSVYQSAMTNSQFLKMYQQGRILITRNHSIFKKIPDHTGVLIRFNESDKQLVQLIQVLKIKWEDVALFSRCLQCNEIIVPIEHEMVHGRVPDYVFETHLNFTTCRMCQKIFWPGTHTERSGKYIKELFDTVYAKDKGDSK